MAMLVYQRVGGVFISKTHIFFTFSPFQNGEKDPILTIFSKDGWLPTTN